MLSDELKQRLRVGKVGGSVSPAAMLEAAIALGVVSGKVAQLSNSEWNRTVGKLDRVCPEWRGYPAPVAVQREAA